jgi:hypothetical protein
MTESEPQPFQEQGRRQHSSISLRPRRLVSRRPHCLLFLFACLLPSSTEGHVPGVPGFISVTKEGFDSGGTEPVCWLASALSLDQSAEILPENERDASQQQYFLHPNTRTPLLSEELRDLPISDIDIQTACPSSTSLQLTIDDDVNERNERAPRGWKVLWDRPFVVKIHVKVDWSEWPGNSRPMGDDINIIVTLCEVLGVRADCSPFVDQSTFLKIQGQTADDAMDESNDTLGPFFESAALSIPSEGTIFEGTTELQLQGIPEGTYSIISSVLFVRTNQTINDTARDDELALPAPIYISVATNIPANTRDQLVTFFQVEDAHGVSKASRTAVYCLSGAGAALIAWLLCQTLLHRNAQVFELTQGKFLIAMLVAALIATVSCFTFEPRNGVYCKLPGPLIILPLHILFSILLGRLWRIRAVISPLLLLTLEKKEHWTNHFVQVVSRVTSLDLTALCLKEGPKDVRRAVTDAQLTRVIGIFVLPQLVWQILIFSVQESNVRVFELDDGSGYLGCSSDFFNSWMQSVGLLLLTIVFVLLVVVAHGCKDFPSLFNETQVFLDVSVLNFVVLSLSAIVASATRNLPISPNVEYLVCSLAVVVVTVNTCVKIILPKLIFAWSGNPIFVTTLLADHRKKKREGSTIIVSCDNITASFATGNNVESPPDRTSWKKYPSWKKSPDEV